MNNIIQTLSVVSALFFAPMLTMTAQETQSRLTEIDVEPGEYTIQAALQKARVARLHGEADHVTLNLKPGEYRLTQTIYLRPEDSHTEIKGAAGKSIVSGGVRIGGWKKSGNKCWVADVPTYNGRQLLFRQMWVNGQKAVRARDVADFEQMARILSMDKAKEVLYVPAAAVRKVAKAQGVEMVLHEMWCVANLRIKDIVMMGDSACVSFHQPESRIHFMHPWPSPMVTTDGHNSAFYLTNAKELLDTKGEWFLDEREAKIYYIPRDGEDMSRAVVEVPALETLVSFVGTPDEPVTDVAISGVTFRQATWLRPSYEGHAPLQAGMYMTEAYKIRPQISRPNGDHKLDNQGWVGRPAAAVELNGVRRVEMSDCVVEMCSSTGVDFNLFVQDCALKNCVVRDCGGNGVLAGSFGGEGHEAHKPYDPTDRRETCNGLVISGNRITDVSNEDWGCVGIGAGYVRNILIEANEISEVSYTGISLGWGWNQQPCTMANNKVVNNTIWHYAKHMYDVAGIYTLGSQPHSLIEGNTVRDIYKPGYVHDPNHWFYLYTDEGSSGITIRNNTVPSEKFLKNSNGPGNEWGDQNIVP